MYIITIYKMKNLKNFKILTIILISTFFLSSCGVGEKVKNIRKPVDLRNEPLDPDERARKNIREGKGLSLGNLGKKKTTYEFSTSNPMWRASLETLDFIPLSTVDYSGGMIITDWYTDNSSSSNESIKITVRFLSNEIRSDSLKVIIHKKRCSASNNCNIALLPESSKVKVELLSVILRKASLLEKADKQPKKNNLVSYMERYNFLAIENKWRNNKEANCVNNSKAKNKFYCLEMFPYPSGKIHMGHVRNYTIGDVIARYKFLNGFNVLHPMGWDAFGLPAENASKQNNLHPREWTKKNISTMKKQLKFLGLSIDWDKEISTCEKEYYKHQQALFIDFYNQGLVSRKETYVNWDPVENTVLANEQVINGRGWRSNAIVERKKLSQWFFNITNFSEELLNDLKNLSGWPDKVKLMQKNWIGKSYGCEINFQMDDSKKTINIFTTRPDTIFGASFIALSVDHPLSENFKNNDQFLKFKKECDKTGTTEEALANAEKVGFKTNFYVKHPFIKNKKIPIYFANFVLMIMDLELFLVVQLMIKEILILQKNTI